MKSVSLRSETKQTTLFLFYIFTPMGRGQIACLVVGYVSRSGRHTQVPTATVVARCTRARVILEEAATRRLRRRVLTISIECARVGVAGRRRRRRPETFWTQEMCEMYALGASRARARTKSPRPPAVIQRDVLSGLV